MSDRNQQSAIRLKELMGQVFESDASEELTQFMVRRIALNDLAPSAENALVEGIDESPDGGAAMAEAHLAGLPEQEREDLLERASAETGRRLHAAAFTLLAAVEAAHLSVEVTPEMVAVSAITELGDSIPYD